MENIQEIILEFRILNQKLKDNEIEFSKNIVEQLIGYSIILIDKHFDSVILRKSNEIEIDLVQKYKEKTLEYIINNYDYEKNPNYEAFLFDTMGYKVKDMFKDIKANRYIDKKDITNEDSFDEIENLEDNKNKTPEGILIAKEDYLESFEKIEKLKKAILKIPELCKKIVHYLFYEKRKMKEIIQLLEEEFDIEFNENNISQRKKSCLKKIKAEMEV